MRFATSSYCVVLIGRVGPRNRRRLSREALYLDADILITRFCMRLSTHFLLLALLIIGLHGPALGQQAVEAEITKLENLEREAVIKADTVALLRLWSPDIIINNPQNRVSTLAQVMGRIRHGLIDYTSFDRTIEKMSVKGDVAVVMGQEVLKPEKKADYVGKTVTRRFTNVWVRTAGTWRLVARQATIVLVQ